MTWQVEVEQLFRKLKPVLGEEKLNKLWLAYQSAADQKSRSEILGILRVLASKHLDESYDRQILLDVPPAELIAGEYPLGRVSHGAKQYHLFGLREHEWIQHVGIFGRSGSGKTNAVFVILWNLLEKKKPFLIFDWKRNYRDILRHQEGKSVSVYTIGREINPLYFNPLIPPENTAPRTWLKKLIEAMCHAYFLGEGVAYLLQKAIDTTYRNFGMYSGNPSQHPTFKDVSESLQSIPVKGRSAQWMDSTLRTLGVLCFGEFSRVLNTRKNSPIEKLLEENVVLELDSLTNSDKTFFIEALLLWIHHFRMAESGREMFKHAIIIEEAHHILLKRKQEMTGEEAVTDIILREIRELGESIILVDQHPSLISMPALGNTYTTICMNLKHKADMRTISDSLLLDAEQVDFLGQLGGGTAIVKLQDRYFRPFLLKIPLFPIRKGIIRDEDIKKGNGGCYDETGDVRAGNRENEVNRDVRGPAKGEEMEPGLGENERKFLIDIAKFPVSGVTTRYSRLGFNRYQGNKIQKVLIRKGHITFRPVSTMTGQIKVLVLTDKGKNEIKGIRTEKIFAKNAGWEHEYWKYRVGVHYKQEGHAVTYEYRIEDGKSVDIVAEKDGKKIAIEIETGKSDFLHNIRKDLDHGFDEVVVVALDRDVRDKILEKLEIIGISPAGRLNITDLDTLNLKKEC